MNKSTRISGVDCKIGRNSRTGSTVTFTVGDDQIINVVQYFNELKAGEKHLGNIKKIELVMYSEDDLSTNLEAEIDSMGTTLDKVLDSSNNGQTIEDVIIEQDEEAEEGHPTGLDIFQEVPRVGRVYDGNGNKL